MGQGQFFAVLACNSGYDGLKFVHSAGFCVFSYIKLPAEVIPRYPRRTTVNVVRATPLRGSWPKA